MFSPKSALSTPTNSVASGVLADHSFSSASVRAIAAAAARRRSTGFNLLSNVKKSPFNIGGRSTPINRSFQTSHISEGGSYSLESYGSSLPALVMEALTFTEKSTELSAVLSPSGSAWLVAGRRLLIWNYKSEGTKRIVNHQFRELTLPSSDLAHKAQLVVVFSPSEGQVPSCVAVSPEGSIRYWSNITHESSYIEMNAELLGQECENLLYLGASNGCLLSTTTSTILQIQFVSGGVSGGHITLHPLKAPAGILGGISRRVTSLVFGSIPLQAPESRLVGVTSLEVSDAVSVNEKTIVVVSARSLQKWCFVSGHPERLLYEANIDKIITDSIIDNVWGRDRVENQLQTWLIDVQPVEGTGSITVLIAAVNLQVSQQIIYALVTLDTLGPSPPQNVSDFFLLKHSECYQNQAEVDILSQKFLLCSSDAYIYSKKSIHCVPATSTSIDEGQEPIRLEFSGPGDTILGIGRSNGIPLVFSANHGIVSIVSSNSGNHLSMDNEVTLNDTIDLTANVTTFVSSDSTLNSADTFSKLQSAFLQYNSRNVIQSQSILDDILVSGENAGLDGAVVDLSTRLIDDIPASDPRWAQANQTSSLSSSSTTSLIIANQIKDKILAHQFFIAFLQKMGLWQRLGIFVENRKQRRISVRIFLAEHCELLQVAAELKSLHQKHQALIDAAVRIVLKERREAPTGQLSNSDVFYRNISIIDDVFWGLTQAQEEVLSADMSPRDASMTIHNVNDIFLTLLKVAKEAKLSALSVSGTRSFLDDISTEYVPWYSSEGPRGLRDVLLKQHSCTVETGLTRADDGSIRGQLYKQLVELTDEILSGFQPHLKSLAVTTHPRHQILVVDYQRSRYTLLNSLVKEEQYSEVIALAEKFCDFRTLVEVCERTDDQNRLNQYMTKFGSQGFSDFVFRWYIETGKRGKLLSLGSSDTIREDLSLFLKDYSNLSWLHDINSGDFDSAKDTLKNLALKESTYLSRKKTLLSLSKLCSVAASECNIVKDNLDPRLLLEEDLVLYQEQLPEVALSAHAIDFETMRVFSPSELIHLYIGEENVCSNEFDFKKALDLLNWIENPEECDDLRREIWVAAILKNSWEHLDTANPVDALSETLFFRTLELAFNQGADLKDVLIPVDDLLDAEKLEKLKENPSFEFLVRAGYEKIEEIIG